MLIPDFTCISSSVQRIHHPTHQQPFFRCHPAETAAGLGGIPGPVQGSAIAEHPPAWSRGRAPSRINRFVPLLCDAWIYPGTANTSLPWSAANAAVIMRAAGFARFNDHDCLGKPGNDAVARWKIVAIRWCSNRVFAYQGTVLR